VVLPNRRLNTELKPSSSFSGTEYDLPAELGARSAVLDGEIVCLGHDGTLTRIF
jgi:hypothetical protein